MLYSLEPVSMRVPQPASLKLLKGKLAKAEVRDPVCFAFVTDIKL